MRQQRSPLKYLLLTGVMGLGLTSSAWALDASDELNTSICLLVGQGVYTAVSEHQAGTPKKQTQKILEQELKIVDNSFSDKAFVQSVKSSWLNALDIIYQSPVQQNPQAKQAFIAEVLTASLSACLDDLQ